MKLDKGREVHFMVSIKAEVDTFMKLMWNWLNQQAWQHKAKRDRVSVAMRQIDGVGVSRPVITAPR